MADLPMSMGQLPTMPAQGTLGQGIAAGVPQGANMVAQAQALQQAKHKQEVDSALQFLATTGQQLQYLRPSSQKLAISNSLNALAKVAPEFGIQPHTPDQIPEEGVDLLKSYAKLHEGYLKGDVTLPTFQSEGSNILNEMSMYERNLAKESQGILGTPSLQPGQANGQSATFNPESGQVAGASGQPMPGAQGNFVGSGQVASIQNEKTQSLARLFNEDPVVKDASQILPDTLDFSTAMTQRLLAKNPDGTPHTATDQEKAQVVASQKLGLLKYMQLNIPASRRPPSMASADFLSSDNLAKYGAEQAYKQLFVNGQPLLPEMQNALLKNGVKIGLNAEKDLSNQESAWANTAQQQGVNPSTILTNHRPTSIYSSSPFFKSQTPPTWDQAAIGQPVQGKSGAAIPLGANRSDPQNWMPITELNQ